jgi:hypothetical protein
VQRGICAVARRSDHGIGSGDTSLISLARGKPTGRPGRKTKLLLPRGSKKVNTSPFNPKGFTCNSDRQPPIKIRTFKKGRKNEGKI